MISIVPQSATTVPKIDVSQSSDFGIVKAEFEALLSSCGVYKMPDRAKVSLTGSDRMRWLNGIVTNNVRDLREGRGVYAFLLNPQGRIQGDLYAYHGGESLMVDVDVIQLQKVTALFDHYIIMDDVEVTDVSEKFNVVGIKGPKAVEIMCRAGLDCTSLEPLQLAELPWRNASVMVVRGDSPRISNYEVWSSSETVLSLLNELKASGATAVGTSALNLMRIAEGIPQFGIDIRERDLPQETEQQRALHFTKGCYIGQEIVERIRSRGNVHRRFTGFQVEGSLPIPGVKIYSNSKDIGEITSSASLPIHGVGYQVALGYIRREAAATGQPVQLDGATLKIAQLPFDEVFKN